MKDQSVKHYCHDLPSTPTPEIGKVLMTGLKIAANFRIASEYQNVKRLIYFSGLGDKNSKISPIYKAGVMLQINYLPGKWDGSTAIGCGGSGEPLIV